MVDLIGSEKQIRWASRLITNTGLALVSFFRENKEFKEDIKIIINNLDNISDAGYIINTFKDIQKIRDNSKKMEFILNWVEYTEHPDFKNIKIDEMRKKI